MACYHCSQLCRAYATLKGNLSSVNGQVSSCLSSNANINSNFNNVVISGKKVGCDEFSSICGKLNSISGFLSKLIKECDQKIKDISSSCPGEDHYDD